MKPQYLYMFCDETASSTRDRAEVETPACKVIIIGVSSINEGTKIAKDFVRHGVTAIELCGAFGYEGANKVSESIGDKVPVGMVVHQIWNAKALANMLGEK